MVSRRHRDRDDRGFTLVELLVAMTIFSLLMAVLTALFITMLGQASDNLGRQRAVEQARLGLSQIDRQVRSGNLILDPSLDGVAQSGVPANYSLRIFTQEGSEGDKCVQWRVIFPSTTSKFGQLQFRSWKPADNTTVTAWTRVASNLVRPAGAFDSTVSATWPPFWVDTSLPTGSNAQNIRVSLRLSDPNADAKAKPQALTSVVTGRNTVFGYSALNCANVPAP